MFIGVELHCLKCGILHPIGTAFMLLVTFAVPYESRIFRRTDAAGGVRILHTGIGEDAAKEALRNAFEIERPSAVISTGFAGGVDPSLQVGDLIADSVLSSPELLRLLSPKTRRGQICTVSNPVDTPAKKARLHFQTGVHAVDMETGVIAAQCALAEVPLLVVRVISDAAGDSIPVPLEIAWNMRRQTARPFRLAAYLALHPGLIGEFYTFVHKANSAAERLSVVLSDLAVLKRPPDCNDPV